MDIRQLQQFLAVVDHGSVGRAARHLKLSQPALSQSIAKLEDRLRVPLFNRTARGMVPTPFGAALAARSRTISEEARRAIEEMDSLRDVGRARVSIGSGPSHANSIVPEAVRRVLIARPKLSISIVEGSLDRLMPALERGDVDLAVLTTVETRWDRELTGEPLYRDPVVIMARRDHPLALSQRPSLKDCIGYPWVLPGYADTLRQRLERIFEEAGLPPPSVRVESASGTAIKAMLACSDFLGFLPRGLTHVEERAGVLRPLDIAAGNWERQVQVVYRQRKALSPPARALIRQLRVVCAERSAAAGSPG